MNQPQLPHIPQSSVKWYPSSVTPSYGPRSRGFPWHSHSRIHPLHLHHMHHWYSNWHRPHLRHFYHHELGIQPILKQTPAVSILSSVDFNELKNHHVSQTTDRSLHGNDGLSSSVDFHDKCKSKFERTKQKLSLKNKAQTSSQTSSQKKVHKPQVLSTLLIEGSSVAQYTTPPNQHINKTVSEILLSSHHFKEEPKSMEKQRTSISLINLNKQMITLPFYPLPGYIRDLTTNDQNCSRKKRTNFKQKDTVVNGISQNGSTFSEVLHSMHQPTSTAELQSKFPKARKTKSFVNKSKLKVEETPLPAIETPRISYSNASSSYINRTTNLQSVKKAKREEEFPHHVNPFPHLTIQGSQFEALAQVSKMMGDIIKSTIDTVNTMLEESEGLFTCTFFFFN